MCYICAAIDIYKVKSPLILLLLSILIVSCSISRKKSNYSKLLANNQYLNFSGNFENVDTSVFILKKSDTIIRNGDTIYRSANYERNINNGYLKHRTLVYAGYVNNANSNNYFEEEDRIKDSMFFVHKEFYLNGNIKEKGIQCVLGFPVGLWYEYNSIGKLIRIADQDKEYKFNTSDVFNYCLKHNIMLSQVRITKIKRRDNKWVWDISYGLLDNSHELRDREIILNAQTGHLMFKRDSRIIE